MTSGDRNDHESGGIVRVTLTCDLDMPPETSKEEALEAAEAEFAEEIASEELDVELEWVVE